MNLFGDFKRTYEGIAKHDQSRYDFLNLSAWKAATYVRNKILEWSQDFPIDRDFVKRFTSKQNQDHAGAFFELVVFQLLKNLNFKVDFQQPASQNSQRKPDFKATQNDVIKFFAECTLSAMPDNDLGVEKLKNQIVDIIESIESPRYFINIDFERDCNIAIPQKKLTSFIKAILTQANTESAVEKKEWDYQENSWHLKFSLIPKKSASVKRSLGMVSAPFKFINSERALRTALDRKRGKNYGSLEHPYLICINSSDIFQDDISIMRTLFGSYDKQGFKAKDSYLDDGFFLCKGRWQNTSVSAVLIFRDLVPWNLHSVEVDVWHNPLAKYPLDQNFLGVEHNTFVLTADEIYERNTVPGRSLGEILSIDRGYLSKEIE